MKISLVVATINRTSQLDELLSSLTSQTFKDFEVIIVDQNSDDRLLPILKKHPELKLQHIQIPPQGVSNARNIGVKKAQGEFLGFPDDDCRYYPNSLAYVAGLLDKFQLVTGRCVDETGASTVVNFEKQTSSITHTNVWRVGVEAAMFIHRETFDALGGFNELLGVGSPAGFGAGEATDLILRHIESDGEAIYDPSLKIYHPPVVTEYNEKAFHRAYSYGKGIGKVLQLNQISAGQKLMTLARPALGATMYGLLLNSKKSRYYFNSFRGRLEGYFS